MWIAVLRRVLVPSDFLRTAARVALVAALLLNAGGMYGQDQKENYERGFSPGKMYQFGNLDSVNVFNGNLIIRIPLGDQYPMPGGWSYGLTLVYNSTLWEYREVVPNPVPSEPFTLQPWSFPNRRNNAGLGWTLSFGRILDKFDSWNNLEGTVYESPDGADTELRKSFLTNTSGLSTNGTYLRWNLDAGTVETADGLIRTFDVEGGSPVNGGVLKRLADRYDNHVDLVQDLEPGTGRPLKWTITDTFGRTHYVYFKAFQNTTGIPSGRNNALQTNYTTVVDRVELETVNGPAVYRFIYADNSGNVDQPTLVFAGPGGGAMGWPTQYMLPVLREIRLANDSSFKAAYGMPNAGGIASLTLPTLGKISWKYGIYQFPKGGDICAGFASVWRNSTGGVTERRFSDPNQVTNGVEKDLGTWKYDQQMNLDTGIKASCQESNGTTKTWTIPREATTKITTPTGHQEIHHFSVAIAESSVPNAQGWVSDLEYGSPQSRLTLDDTGSRGISTEFFECVNGGGCELKRTKYIRYVFDDTVFDSARRVTAIPNDNNPRVESEREVFEDGTHHDTDYSDYDGFGHYRRTISGGTSPNGGTGVIGFTNYNPGTDELGRRGGVFAFAALDPWVLNTWDHQLTIDGSKRAKVEACFDAKGFLQRVRTLKNGPDASLQIPRSSQDLLTVNTSNLSGDLVRESFYGGDGPVTQALADGALCGLALPSAPRYAIEHSYQNGVRATSKYLQNGVGIGFNTLDLTVHRSGAVISERDSAGLETIVEYEPWGALKSVKPPGWSHVPPINAVTSYVYNNASVSGTGVVTPATVAVHRGDTEMTYAFDPLGRVWRERQLLPGNKAAVRETLLDAGGRKISETEWLEISPAASWTSTSPLSAPTTFFAYDAFDRMVRTTAPDQSIAELIYSGVKSMDRRMNIRTSATGPLTTSTTTELYDRLGRLVEIHEPSGAGGAMTVTKYGYGLGSRLTSVQIQGSINQDRSFAFDNRGFVQSETHPENGTVNYTYDARGHILTKGFGGAQSALDLQYQYDAAERLTEVSARNPFHVSGSSNPDQQEFRVMKSSVFGTANLTDNFVKGKLQTAIRYNYPADPSSASAHLRDIIRVTETYSYAHDQVRRTSRQTAIGRSSSIAGPWTTLRVLNQSTEFNALGLPGLIAYPACTDCAAPVPGPLRNLVPAWDRARVVGIPGFVTGISYLANGMTSTIAHANGITDTQLPDPSGMPRTLSISTSPFASCAAFTITSPPVDTAVDPATGKATFTIAVSGTGVTVKWYKGLRGNTSVEVGQGLSFTTPALSANTQYWARATNLNGCATDSMTVNALVCPPARIVSPAADVPLLLVKLLDRVSPSVQATGSSIQYRWTVSIDGRAETPLPSTGPLAEYTFVDETGKPKTNMVVIKATVLGGCSVNDTDDVTFTYQVAAEAAEPCPAFNLELDLATPWILFGDETSILQISPEGMLGGIPGNLPLPESDYGYEWFRNGQSIGSNTSSIAVSAGAGDVYQAKVTRTCRASGLKSEKWSSKTFVYRWGTCELPLVTVDQTTITLPTSNLKFVAHCEHPGAIYQWYSGAVGDTRNPITVDPSHRNELTAADLPGIYWLRVSLDCGTSKDLGPFVVRHPSCSPVFISQNPLSADIEAGTSVTLFADATSNPAPHLFQWFEGLGEAGQPVGTGTRFTARPVRTKHYWFQASSTCSTASSMPALLRVTSCADINIAAQPANASVPENQFADLTITASAAETLRYQWYEGESGDDSHPVAGAQSPTLRVTPAQTTKYWVRLSFDREGACAVDSRTATVFVCRMPVLRPPLQAPSSQWPNVPKWLSVDVTGENLTYKWYEGSAGGTLIGEASMVKVQPAQTTRYFVRVTSPCQPPMSNAVLDVGPILYSVCPTIHTDPQPATVMLNTSANLSVEAFGTELRYEWYSIDPVTGVQSGVLGTAATFVTPPITKDTEFRVRVYSGNCARNSAKALVTYCREPHINWVRGFPQVRANQYQDLGVTVTPADARLYWYQGTAGDIAGSTLLSGPTVNRAIYVQPTQTTSYWVRAEKPNTACSDQTTTFTVTVCMAQILTQPQGTLVTSGTPVHLTVGADGGALTYQWYEGAAGVTTTPVGTNANFLDVPATTTKSYWVRVTGTCGDPADSEVATVTVCAPPVITQQPASVNAQQGVQFTTGISATGTNLSYQWYQGAVGVTTAPVGDDSPIFSSSTSATTDYWVKVTGMCGSVNSAGAKVSIPPVITTEPASVRITYNTTATLSVVASGTQLSYQWYRGSGTSQPVSGAISASYTTPLTTADTSYWVRVFSGTQSKNSATATVTVCPAPNVSMSQPSLVAGSAVTLTVSNPYPGDAFAWYQGSAPSTATPLGGGTTKTVYPTQTTSYWVRASSASCFADSLTKVVTVCYPRIDVHPQGSMINSGSSKTLSVTAVGTPPLTYQWYAGDTGNTSAPIGGVTSSASVTVSPTADTMYWVRVLSGAGGACAADSNATTVTVCNAPAITQQPAGINAQSGVPFTIGVSATGMNLSYQWYVGAAGVTTTPVGENSPLLSITAATTTDYWVKVTGTCGTVNSAAAKVSIKPGISTEPASVRITYNTTATLSVVASGTQLSYQWYRGSGTTQPVGASAASYTTPLTTADTSYWVRVFSGTNFRDSATATVTVCPAPNVSVSQPSLVAGSAVTLTVTNPYPGDAFAWYQGNAPSTATPLGAGTSKTVYPTQTTSYWVRSTGSGCLADSLTKVVSVCYPRIDAHPQSTGIALGASTTLSVTAVGTPPLTYQWYAGDTGNTSAPVGGVTSSATVSVSPTVQTMYWVQVRSAAGGSCVANSSAATVSVCTPPVITQHPGSTSVSAPNAWMTIGVSATGEGLHYQWFRGPAGNTTTPVGDDNAVLSLPVNATTDFWVRVTGTCGVVNSNAAKVSVPATITTQPASVTICTGAATTLSIAASGNELSYQWYEGPVGNRTKPLGTATTQSASPAVTTTFWCDVRSGQVIKVSNGAVVTIKPPPTVTSITRQYFEPCTRLQAQVSAADANKVLYYWYSGAVGNTSNLVGSGPVYWACTDGAYWLRVEYTPEYGSCSTAGIPVMVP